MAGERGALIELDFSDDEFIVRQHPDGMITIDVSDGRLLINEEEFKEMLKEMARVGREKGWLTP